MTLPLGQMENMATLPESSDEDFWCHTVGGLEIFKLLQPAHLPSMEEATYDGPLRPLPMPPTPRLAHASLPVQAHASPPVQAHASVPAQAHASLHARGLAAQGIMCTRCGLGFQRLSDLRRHSKGHKNPTISCTTSTCTKKFYRIDKMKDHVKRVHEKNNTASLKTGGTRPDRYKCDESGCNETFDRQRKFERHKLSHLDRKDLPWKCKECLATFYWEKDLRRTCTISQTSS